MPAAPAPGAPEARFDDLTPGAERAWEMQGRTATLVATRLDEVVHVLDEVERATRAGAWAAGFVAYDAAPALEPAARVPGDTISPATMSPATPLVWFGVYERRVEVAPLRPGPPGATVGAVHAGLGPARHAELVAEVRDRIAAGDVYQVNLTQQLTAGLDGHPWDLYRAMAWAQRGAGHAYLDTGAAVVASASPELFFSLAGDVARVRPMKGTARRGRWAAEDVRAGEALVASAKDRAENVMIVDLLRNDLSRLAEVGSVRVEELCRLERYPTVWQLTSTVSARLRGRPPLAEVFRALFPCGSVTGAPKIAAMAAIAELEPEARGLYCGAIGWVGPPDEPERARFTVAIRTAVVTPAPAGTPADVPAAVRYGSGGAITWDSRPDAEHDEVLAKARVLTDPPPPFELLETMRAGPDGDVALLGAHLDRMGASAEHFAYAFDRAAVEAAVRRALAAAGPGGATATDRTVRLRLGPRGELAVDVTPAPPVGEPVVLAVCELPVDAGDALWFHKTTARERYDRRRATRPDVDDVILLDADGRLTETTIATLAVRLDGVWWTPPVEAGCLPGVARRVALEEGRLRERPLHRGDLARAEAVATLNALRGWRPATLVP